MKGLAAVAFLVALAACSKTDEVRDSAAPKPAPVANTSSTEMTPGTPSEVPNSASPDDVQVGGGIRH
ncbi:MAG TPA: hypothetical protein VKR43_23540 [Bryobacteraceae bacterium]|nr:hypothetical protein [Bryobacteraceae bacterium]